MRSHAIRMQSAALPAYPRSATLIYSTPSCLKTSSSPPPLTSTTPPPEFIDLPGPAWPESQENGLAFRASGFKIWGQKYVGCIFYLVQVTFNIILVFPDLWMAWCVFPSLYPTYVLISDPLHRYTVCIPPEFHDQLANAPPSRVQIKTREIGVIFF